MPQSTTAVNPARRRVTAVIGRYRAGAVDVCKCDQEVALHFGTPSGIVIITLELAEFFAKCRGTHCYNGHPLPNPGAARGVENRHEAGGAVGEVKKRRSYFTTLQPEVVARYEAMMRDLVAAPSLTAVAAARRHGANVAFFYAWRSRQLAAATARAPILKPGGKIL